MVCKGYRLDSWSLLYCLRSALCGCTTVLFEGKPVGTPDAGVFGIISEYKSEITFLLPQTAIRAIKKEDPDGKFFKKYDLSKFDTLFLAGERAGHLDTIKVV